MRFMRRFRKGPRAVIPHIEASQLVDDSLPITMKFYTFAPGSVTPYERLILNALLRKENPATVLEIGTFDGRTTWNMAANTSDATTIYTLDLPKQQLDSTHLSIDSGDRRFIDKDVSGRECLGTEQGRKIRQLFGDTAAFDFSPFHDSIDFVFVDGSHSYDYVKNDSQIAFKLLKGGKGVILWHDYDRMAEWPGCTEALNELYSAGGQYAGLRRVSGTSFVICRMR